MYYSFSSGAGFGRVELVDRQMPTDQSDSSAQASVASSSCSLFGGIFELKGLKVATIDIDVGLPLVGTLWDNIQADAR